MLVHRVDGLLFKEDLSMEAVTLLPDPQCIIVDPSNYYLLTGLGPRSAEGASKSVATLVGINGYPRYSDGVREVQGPHHPILSAICLPIECAAQAFQDMRGTDSHCLVTTYPGGFTVMHVNAPNLVRYQLINMHHCKAN